MIKAFCNKIIFISFVWLQQKTIAAFANHYIRLGHSNRYSLENKLGVNIRFLGNLDIIFEVSYGDLASYQQAQCTSDSGFYLQSFILPPTLWWEATQVLERLENQFQIVFVLVCTTSRPNVPDAHKLNYILCHRHKYKYKYKYRCKYKYKYRHKYKYRCKYAGQAQT